MASGGTRIVCGSFVGTGADMDIESVGFKPRSVKVINRSGLARAEWNEAMPDDSMAKQVTDGTLSFPTSNGITPLDSGFALGADADMNVSGEVCYYEAHE